MENKNNDSPKIGDNIKKPIPVICVVVDKNGPDKRNYRIMNIRAETNNDYLALSEAIERRYTNLLKNKLSLPEVILIDGGKGQLNFVKKNLDKKNFKKLNILSISKGPNRNEKYDTLHLESGSHDLKKLKNISKLLQFLRNESHRFAIRHHRKRRSKDLLSSNLDNISGVGPKLRSKLIRFFGGYDKVLDATIEDLISVPGIGMKKAKSIYLNLNKK